MLSILNREIIWANRLTRGELTVASLIKAEEMFSRLIKQMAECENVTHSGGGESIPAAAVFSAKNFIPPIDKGITS